MRAGRLFGYTIDSSLPLARTRDRSGGRGSISIRRVRSLAREHGDLIAFSDEFDRTLALASVGGGNLLLVCGETGDYLIDHRARTISVAPLRGADAAVEHRLVSTAVPMLLSNLGDIALHAACVGFGDSAVAFLGRSGIGKSTLAAALATRGHPTISEDGTIIELRDRGAFAWPGPTGHKLDSRTARALGAAAVERPPGADASAPLSLTALVALEPPMSCPAPARRLRGAVALAEVAGSLLHSGASRFDAALAGAAELLRAVPLYSAALPDDLARVGEAGERLVAAIGGRSVNGHQRLRTG